MIWKSFCGTGSSRGMGSNTVKRICKRKCQGGLMTENQCSNVINVNLNSAFM